MSDMPAAQEVTGFAKLASWAAGFVSSAGKMTANVLVPAKGPVGDAAAVTVTAAGVGVKAAGEGVARVATAAASGVKTGFGFAVFLIVGLLGLYLLGMFRNATR